MAKNKKKTKNSGNNGNNNNSNDNGDANNQVADLTTQGSGVEVADAIAPETPQHATDAGLQPSDSVENNKVENPSVLPVEDMTIEDLRAEVHSLREQLKAKDTEVVRLKDQVARPLKSASSGISPITDMQQLQERLAKLRKEQAEADAARDAAWGQLKSVVAEISKLANPDYVASLVQQQGATVDNGTSK